MGHCQRYFAQEISSNCSQGNDVICESCEIRVNNNHFVVVVRNQERHHFLRTLFKNKQTDMMTSAALTPTASTGAPITLHN